MSDTLHRMYYRYIGRHVDWLLFRRSQWLGWHRKPVKGWRASLVKRFGEPGFVYNPATGEQWNVRVFWRWTIDEHPREDPASAAAIQRPGRRVSRKGVPPE